MTSTTDPVNTILDAFPGDAPFDKEQVKAVVPALASYVETDEKFRQEHLHRLAVARNEGDEVEAQRLAQQLVDLNASEQRALDSTWQPDGTRADPDSDRRVGAKHQPGRPLTEVAKEMRADIKKAKASGFLPDDLDYRVAVDAGGGITTTVLGMADDRHWWRNPFAGAAREGLPWTETTWESRSVEKRLAAISDTYAASQYHSGMDQYDFSHHTSTAIETEGQALWRTNRSEAAALARKIKKTVDQDEYERLTVEHDRMLRDQAAAERKQRVESRDRWDW